ncbi:hypothetical protein M9458_021044, partial [Cirrhinus mrigala]
QHTYANQQSTHNPPLQSTPAYMYPQEQVFGLPIRFESPATPLSSPYSEEYYGHNVPQPTVNPTLPEPEYFTKQCAVTSTQPSRSTESNAAEPKHQTQRFSLASGTKPMLGNPEVWEEKSGENDNASTHVEEDEEFKFESSTTGAEKSSSSSSCSLFMPAPVGGLKFGIAESEAKPSDRQSQSGSASDLLKNIAELHKQKEKEAVPSSSDQSVEADSHDSNPLITGKPDTVSFADLAKSQSNFQFQKNPTFKGFPGAGEQLFTGLHSSPKADTSVDQDDKMYKTDENGDIQFNTDVPPHDLVEVSAGGENEEVHFSDQAKSYHNDEDLFQTPGANLGTQSTKTLVSSPKYVFGSDPVQIIFGSPSPSKEKSPDMMSSSKDEETGASRLKTTGPAVTK